MFNLLSKAVRFRLVYLTGRPYCIVNSQYCNLSVSLQPFEYDPNEKNKHKFMVQSMFAPDGDVNAELLVR